MSASQSDEQLTEEEKRRLNAVLRSLGEAADMAGAWPLDQFVRRHAQSAMSALHEAALEIDQLQTSQARSRQHEQAYTALALVSAFTAVSTAVTLEVSALHLSTWLWIAVAGTAVGVIGRYISWRAYRTASNGIGAVNDKHFTPHGVFYVSKGAMVYRSPIKR